MLNSFPLSLAVGSLLGFLSGLGVGGGSLLMLWLTLVHSMEVSQARTINLLFFLPCALISAFFRWKQGHVNLKKILPAMISGCLGALVFSWLGVHFRENTLRTLFGILLIATGIRELCYQPKA